MPGPEPAAIETSSAPAASVGTAPAPPPTNNAAPAAAPAESPKPPVVIPVQQEWKGAESGIQETRLVVIRNKEGWEKLWTEMQVHEPPPEIHFSRNIVVGVFAGASPAGSAVSMGKIEQMEDAVYAPYRIAPARVQDSGPTGQGPSHPYLLSLIPRVDKKIRLVPEEAPR